MGLAQISNSEIWLRPSEVGELLDLTKRAINKTIHRFTYKESGCQNKGYYILLTSLPEKAQSKYWEAAGVAPAESIEPDTIENDGIIYAELPDWQKIYIDKFLKVIKDCSELKGSDLKKYLEQHREETGVKGLSYANFMRAKKAFEDEGIEGLLPDWGKTAGQTIIDSQVYEYFKKLYLKEGGPSLQACWLGAKGFYIKANGGEIPGEFPSPVTFLRKLKNEIPKSAIYLSRNGFKKYNKRYASFVNRSYKDIAAGEIWVSDHRQLDQACTDIIPSDVKDNIKKYLEYYGTNHQGKRNKPVFPWITVWRCFKTGKWLGWDIHPEAPNADHIFQSFYNAAIKYGVPEAILIDNGKDYRCNDFAGGRNIYKLKLDDKKIDSMMNLLNITVHYAKAYNAQAKPIERDFKIWKEWVDKQMVGYRGGNVVERPEKLMQEIRQNKLMDINELRLASEYFIENILHKFPGKGKNMGGRSRDEAFNTEFKGLRKISDEALKLFCMRTSLPLTIGRNGLTISREHCLYYWGEWMQGRKGTRVYMRRDPSKYQEAWVFDVTNDEYLGKAYLSAWDSPAFVKDDLSKMQLAGLLKAKQQELKIMESYLPVNNLQPQEILHNMAIGLASASKDESEQIETNETNVILKTMMDEVYSKDVEISKTGTYSLGIYEPKVKKKRTIYLLESEKRRAEEQSANTNL